MARKPVLPPRIYSRIADNLANFGSVVDNKIDLAAASAELGVTRSAVREVLSRERGKMSSQFFGTMTGRTGDISGRPDPANIKDQLLAAYGPGRRSEVNTAAAAKDLGVSQRTVERWIAPQGRQRITNPRLGTLATLAGRAKQAATTKTGRRTAMRTVRVSKQGKSLAKYGGKLTIDAVQGPKNYERDRAITLELTPDQVEAMWAAYEQGGDKAMVGWLNGRGDDYVGGWSFLQINDFDLGR